MQANDPITALKNLGLTGLEAEIYVSLLRKSPATGYSVAKGLGKPTANVYKALDTLALKGAVEIEEGKKRLIRPVPYKELLQNLEMTFQRLRDTAAESLASLPDPDHDHRIYHLHTLDQVLGRCRALMDEARSLVVADVFPETAELLRPEFEKLVKRGLNVVVRTYGPFELEGASINLATEGKQIQGRWPAQWMNLVVDGEHSLISVLQSGTEEVIQSFWTSSSSLAYVHHSGLVSEIGFSVLRRNVAEGCSHREMQKSIERVTSCMGPSVPGYRQLLSNLGLDTLPQTTEKDQSHE